MTSQELKTAQNNLLMKNIEKTYFTLREEYQSLSLEAGLNLILTHTKYEPMSGYGNMFIQAILSCDVNKAKHVKKMFAEFCKMVANRATEKKEYGEITKQEIMLLTTAFNFLYYKSTGKHYLGSNFVTCPISPFGLKFEC